jgi:hypothetical protein
MKRLIGIAFVLALIVSALSSHSKSNTPSTTTASAEESASASPSTEPQTVAVASYTRCDQNIKAAQHTTCGFADSVFRAFAHDLSEGGGEDHAVDATSPATGHTLTVDCQTSEGHTVCSTGGQARVRFPLSAAQAYYKPAPTPEATPSYSPPSAEPYEEEPGEPEPGESEPYGPEEPECTNGTYVNAAGNTVCSPEESPREPAGATAECADGTYSFSESRSGTCSHHGGVAQWLEG